MFKTLCPSCGAEAVFRSAASCLLVCEYCQSTLLKEADAVKDVGKMGQVLEDYSPLQIGTSGVQEGVAFSVIGRIQLRYDAGFWNEWYVLGDDGQAAWLSDASGQYVLTRPIQGNPRLPAFPEFKPGKPLQYRQRSFTVSDVRTARCVAGEGELPFRVGEGWEARVVDLRAGADFLTLDFSEGLAPQCYAGSAVTLESLKCQLLRDPDAIVATAGRYRGKLQALACPQCGAGMTYLPGVATQLLCQACHTQVDCTEDKATVLQAHTRMASVHTTLALGDKGVLQDVAWTVIGLLQRHTVGEDDESWCEYLLFNAVHGFLWLVESAEGWDQVEVLNTWPEVNASASTARYQGKPYQLLYRYAAKVSYAAGAFNWRVGAGDVAQLCDYGNGNSRLCMEQTASEITWSLSTRLSPAFLAKAFNKPALAAGAARSQSSKALRSDEAESPIKRLGGTAIIASIALLLFTLPAIISRDAFAVVFFGLLALWWPVFPQSDDD